MNDEKRSTPAPNPLPPLTIKSVRESVGLPPLPELAENEPEPKDKPVDKA